MPVPDADAIREFLVRNYEIWNGGELEDWVAHYRSFVTGEPCIEDPIGTPPKRGWDVIAELWRQSGPDRLRVRIEDMIVRSGEAAVISLNYGAVCGKPVLIKSIDCFRFDQDGNLYIRSYWSR